MSKAIYSNLVSYRFGSWTSIENFLSLKYRFSKYFQGKTYRIPDQQ